MDIDKEGGIVDLGEHLCPSLSETRWIIKNIFQNNEHEYKKNSRLNTKIQSRIWSENRYFFQDNCQVWKKCRERTNKNAILAIQNGVQYDSVGIRQNHAFSGEIGYFAGRNNAILSIDNKVYRLFWLECVDRKLAESF